MFLVLALGAIAPNMMVVHFTRCWHGVLFFIGSVKELDIFEVSRTRSALHSVFRKSHGYEHSRGRAIGTLLML